MLRSAFFCYFCHSRLAVGIFRGELFLMGSESRRCQKYPRHLFLNVEQDLPRRGSNLKRGYLLRRSHFCALTVFCEGA